MLSLIIHLQLAQLFITSLLVASHLFCGVLIPPKPLDIMFPEQYVGTRPLYSHDSIYQVVTCSSLPAAMLQQPRVPPTGQRQAIEIHIKWREVLAQKKNMLHILSKHTGHSVEKLDKVSQAPVHG